MSQQRESTKSFMFTASDISDDLEIDFDDDEIGESLGVSHGAWQAPSAHHRGGSGRAAPAPAAGGYGG